MRQAEEKPTLGWRRLLAHPMSQAARKQAATWLGRMPSGTSSLWVGHGAPADVARVNPAQAGHWLGREIDAIVFEATWPLPADALAIVGGLLRGGGVLLLLVAPPGDGAFGRRWAKALRHASVHWVDDDVEQWPIPTAGVQPPWAWTEGQRRGLATLDELGPGECGALVANRGRGKSTLLGEWIAGQRSTSAPVIVTAPGAGAVQALFRQLECHPGPSVSFFAPDQVEALATPPDTLVIDEAAALPVDRLVRLAERVRRLVLATTTGGFEGSGQGFRLRALPALQRLGFRIRQIWLEQPVRWASGDPLEAWLDGLFLMQARSRAPAPQAVRFHWLRGKELARDARRLEDVAGLLADAHYRTRPSDLTRWLDDPDAYLMLLVGAQDRALFGVALVQKEGGLAPKLAEAVWAGERRPQGHFLPCTLAARGEFALATRAWWRIQRLAVHPSWQGRGLGSRLLRAVEECAAHHDIALLGTSFGLQPALVRFWGQTGWRPVRVGERPDPASGEVSIVLIRAMTQDTAALVDAAAASFARDWREGGAALLRDQTGRQRRALEAIQPSTVTVPVRDHARDIEEIGAFALRQRPLEWIRAALRRSLVAHPPQGPEGRLLQSAIESLDGEALARELGLSGRREAIRRLRQAAQTWLAHPEA
ncbi:MULTISPECIES: GNAT family N-acetyltransferase [unclassified Thioalkalivibrio]|uniref:GNAT family N-acetyltransferase n=1 Tax=unclassified Thioalkalivibrio TaxID=2621013 RepID=UPI00037333D0|nr:MULTISPECIES: GNAT family N-acetyltransferase [unclassified Thioalkalivibrio]